MGQLVLVAPPYLPFAPALQAAGIDAKRLCAVQPGRSAQDLAWACEQALHCRDVLAVLAWLPELPASTLRRLQLAAASQSRPLWLWQELQAEPLSSPAALRLRLERVTADSAAQQAPGLQIQILKRRGPLLERPIQLPLSQWASSVLQAQAQDMRARARGCHAHARAYDSRRSCNSLALDDGGMRWAMQSTGWPGLWPA
jgi:protein ImuA